jgi:hypothetical protein
MYVVLGLLLGIIIGIGVVFALSKFCRGVTSGKLTGVTMLFLLAGTLLPFGLLTLVAFLWTDALVWAGAAAGTTTMISGIVLFMHLRK